MCYSKTEDDASNRFTDPAAATNAYNSLSADARLQDMLSSLKYLQGVSQYDPAKIAAALPKSLKVLLLCGG